MDLKNYMKANPPRLYNKLCGQAREIESMVAAGYSLSEMQRYFKQKGINVTIQALGYQKRVVIPRLQATRVTVEEDGSSG